MYKLKIEMPSLLPGTEVQIHGLGTFKNGKEYEIDDEAAEVYRNANQTQETVATEDGTAVVEVKRGPTLLEAFRGVEGVTVATVKAQKAAESKKTENKEPDQPELPEADDTKKDGE